MTTISTRWKTDLGVWETSMFVLEMLAGISGEFCIAARRWCCHGTTGSSKKSLTNLNHFNFQNCKQINRKPWRFGELPNKRRKLSINGKNIYWTHLLLADTLVPFDNSKISKQLKLFSENFGIWTWAVLVVIFETYLEPLNSRHANKTATNEPGDSVFTDDGRCNISCGE